MLISCRLLKYVSKVDWIELSRKISVDVFTSGIVLREESSGSLLADFPNASIEQMIVLPRYMMRIVLRDETEKFALKFANEFDHDSFLRLLHNHNVSVSTKATEHVNNKVNLVPDVNDKYVQELLLQLLFSDKFKSFVNDLGELLGQMTDNIS